VTALAQQELLEAPPARRIIVPRGCGWVWGVDGSTRCAAIAATAGAAGDVRHDVRSVPFPQIAGPGRLRVIYNDTRALAAELAAVAPPGLVLVEQPSGSMQAVNHELEYAVGVIQAAVLDGIWSVLGHGAQMETVVSSWWKVRACGRGDIYKTQKVPGKTRKVAVPFEEYGVLRWARLNGYEGSSWDEADAMGIAEAGRRDTGLEER
jgi:hypothetical protein